MLTMSKMHGNLGNNLFQAATLYALSNGDLTLPDWKYNEYFKHKFKTDRVNFPIVKEKHYHYKPDQFGNLQNNIDIIGWLQSDKYWKDKKDEILRLFEFSDEVQDEIDKKYGLLLSKKTIAISIRRGDYVDNPAYHLLPIQYYYLALFEYFPDWEDYQILIFSDDPAYCKVHFECLPNATIIEDTPINQLCLGSACDNFIIANSTFSWWMAYLGQGKTIRPTYLFEGHLKAQNTDKDFWPSEWVPFDYKGKRLDARDVTFMIPVSYDHPDRKQNLDLCVCMLQREFETNIIIAENKNNVFEYQSQWCQYVKYNHEHFHRTKMLNDMAKLAKTDYIVNYDCDNFIPPLQNYMMILELRKGVDMVYPFDGQSARMPRADWFTKFEKYLDCGIVRDTKFMGKNGGKPRMSSVGHAMGWNIQSYWDGGGENEYFISFGPEDVERYERFSRLGYTVKRIEGAVYHMDHYCGPDSSNRNPFFRTNHDLLKKYRAMTDEELRKEVDTWDWSRHYTAAYYETITEDAIKSRDAVFEILGINKNDSIIDAGCGVGQWGVGLNNYIGIDYRVPIHKLLIDYGNYLDFDLRKELDISSVLPFTVSEYPGKRLKEFREVDYCLCLEVAEHLPESAADTLIENLVMLSDIIIFSAAIPNQGGQNHINEQWQDYWAEKFAIWGFGAAMEKEQKKIRQDKRIALWYRQNLVIYKRGAKGKVEPYVLPDYWLERTK